MNKKSNTKISKNKKTNLNKKSSGKKSQDNKAKSNMNEKLRLVLFEKLLEKIKSM